MEEIHMKKEQEIEIEYMRKELIKLGLQKGFTHHETIKVSQRLDVLINAALTKNLQSCS